MSISWNNNVLWEFTHIDLHAELRGRYGKGILNIKNNENKCFV